MRVRGGAKGGMTLIEVVIASALFMMVIVAFSGACVSALRTHEMASDYYRATCLARNRIQRARTLEFSSLSLLAESNATIDEDGNFDIGGRYRRTTTVSAMSPTVYEVTVQVYFPQRSGVSPVPVAVSTRLAKPM